MLVLLLACTLLAAAWAQPGVPGIRGAGGGVATRVVSAYLERERSLQNALQQRQRSAAVRFLADDFTLRTSASEDVQSADEWLQHEFALAHLGGIVRDLSVREVDDVAIVSFLLDRGTAGRHSASTLFIVDVWRQSTRHLLSRSMTSAIGSSAQPGRPSGKE